MPTASGLSRLAAIEEELLRERLAQVLAAAHGYTIVHCCATTGPVRIIRAAGADAVPFDLSQLRRGEEDGVAEAAEAGMGLLPARSGRARRAPGLRLVRGRLRDRGRPNSQARISHPADGSAGPRERRAGDTAVAAPGAAARDARGTGGDHPGLRAGGASPAQARAALDAVPGGRSMLAELIEETGGEPR